MGWSWPRAAAARVMVSINSEGCPIILTAEGMGDRDLGGHAKATIKESGEGTWDPSDQDLGG